ncbi:MAG: histidine kinase [Paenibacillus sp.]|nr:histidine kinase [Paenibacillus sp.]
MSDKRKEYVGALKQYIQTGSYGSLHPVSLFETVLRDVAPEEIVMLHERSINLLISGVDAEEGLRYYKQSMVFLIDLIVFGRFQYAQQDIKDLMLQELQDLLFKSHSTFQQASSKYEDVLQHLDCGIILFDSEGFISFINVQMAKFLNVPRKSLLGCNLRSLMGHHTLSRSFRKLIYKCYQEMYVYRLRYQEVIDDTGRHYLVTATYGDDMDGDILFSVKDITDFKRIEQTAYQNDKLALLGKIAASIAHEVRNPLTSIRGFIQLLRPHLKPLGKEEYAKIILDEIDRANDIIYEFLNSSKPSTPDKQEIHVNALLKDISLLFESEALLRSCEIELLPVDPGLILCVDVKQMKQALLNLVKNSLDAVERAIGERADMERNGNIRISADKQGEKIRITLQDNGTGMDNNTLSRLFDPFFTTKEEGTGLGLAVCYRIIKNHGGTIAVDSVIGEGTMFTITLPSC